VTLVERLDDRRPNLAGADDDDPHAARLTAACDGCLRG
jgi:hypothetical protein